MRYDSGPETVRISGLTSVHECELALDTPVSVLIGSNGSGKSNLVQAFEVLGRIVDQGLQTFIVEQGGLSSLLHKSSRPGLSADENGIDIWGTDEEGSELGYRAVVRPGPGDQGLITEYLRDRPVGKSRPELRGRRPKDRRGDPVGHAALTFPARRDRGHRTGRPGRSRRNRRQPRSEVVKRVAVWSRGRPRSDSSNKYFSRTSIRSPRSADYGCSP